MARSVLELLKASHPEPALVVTAVAGLLAWGVGHSPAGVITVTATVGSSQLAVGWTNDWLDADRDTAVGRSDKPLATGVLDRRVVGIAAMVAALMTPVLALTTNLPAAAWAAGGLLSALLYDWPLKFTAASVLPYAISFGALPAFTVQALPDSPGPPIWLLVAGALLGAGAHFANVLPDLADDAQTGVRGLPHRIGSGGARTAAAGFLLGATVVLVLGPPGAPSRTGFAAIMAAAMVPPFAWYAGRSGAGRSAVVFRLVMLVAVIDVVLLIISGKQVV